MKYLRLLRVKHYIKNGLVFLPLFFARRVTAVDLLFKSLLAFAVFCLISSAVYILNDIRDVQHDQIHPLKRNRPIASGAVSKNAAWVVFALLLLFAAVLLFFTGQGVWFWLLPAGYVLINAAYSLGLKNVPIVDIGILSIGYLLRVMYGSVFTGIPISGWMYLTVIAVAFYLGLGKRRGEAVRCAEGGDTRPVLRFYSQGFLDKNMMMCVTLGIVFYSLWTVDAGTVARVGGEQAVWTVPLLILIFFKYSMAIEKNSEGDPVEILWKDKLLLALVALLGLALFAIVYF